MAQLPTASVIIHLIMLVTRYVIIFPALVIILWYTEHSHILPTQPASVLTVNSGGHVAGNHVCCVGDNKLALFVNVISGKSDGCRTVIAWSSSGVEENSWRIVPIFFMIAVNQGRQVSE